MNYRVYAECSYVFTTAPTISQLMPGTPRNEDESSAIRTGSSPWRVMSRKLSFRRMVGPDEKGLRGRGGLKGLSDVEGAIEGARELEVILGVGPSSGIILRACQNSLGA